MPMHAPFCFLNLLAEQAQIGSAFSLLPNEVMLRIFSYFDEVLQQCKHTPDDIGEMLTGRVFANVLFQKIRSYN